MLGQSLGSYTQDILSPRSLPFRFPNGVLERGFMALKDDSVSKILSM